MAAILLGRKYMEDRAYGGVVALHRIKTTASPDTFIVAPIQSTTQAKVVSANFNGVEIGLNAPSFQITVSVVGAAAQTLTILGRIYTLRAVPGTEADAILVGGSTALGAEHICDAINANPATSGTSFGSLTKPNPNFIASVSGSTVTCVSKSAGGSGRVGVVATNIVTLSLIGETTHATTVNVAGGSVNSGGATAGAPVVTVSGDRTTIQSTVTVSGFPVGTEVVLMTVHGNSAGLNSSAIG